LYLVFRVSHGEDKVVVESTIPIPINTNRDEAATHLTFLGVYLWFAFLSYCLIF